jgi:peptidoglycan/xylan/chitin deacetylase (PgdA/CDA1 family)
MTPFPGLPDGHACALALTFDVDAETPILDLDPASANDASAMTHQAFGPRVGVPRLLRVLREEQVKATFFVPGWTARRWPAAVEAILADEHEIAHHSDLHRSPTALSQADERADFERALETLTALGAEVRGHRAAYWQASWHTLALVAEYGLAYDSSLMDDDRPYALEVGGKTIVELPPHFSLDDWEQYGYLIHPDIGSLIEPASKVVELWTSELDAQRREGGLVVGTMHPFLSGRASRAEALRAVIHHARAARDVWIAPLGEISDRVVAAGAPSRPLNPPPPAGPA